MSQHSGAQVGGRSRTWLGWSPAGALVAELTVYAVISVLLIQEYSAAVNAFDRSAVRLQTHEQIVNGTALDPYRFRVLLPVFTHALQAVGLVPDDPAWLDRAYFLIFGACFFALLLSCRLMLTAYGWRPSVSLAGPLILAALLPVSFRYHDFQPWSWPEALSVALLVTVLLRRRSIAWVAVIVSLASLNRETAVVLCMVPIALIVSQPRGARRDRYLITAAVVSTAIWLITRMVLVLWAPGAAPGRVIELEELWRRNLNPESVFQLGFTVLAFVAVPVIASIIGVVSGRAPRRAIWVALFTVPWFIGGYVVFALWIEVRVLVPALIVALPLVVAAFEAPRGGRLYRPDALGVSNDPEALNQP